jgi:D-glycero-alpha-D-manno-heptose-7-phosphate kinase
MILSKAPVRILDIGGWTDTWFYPNGAVFNVCIDRYTYTKIEENQVNKTRIIAENLNQQIEIDNLNDIMYNGTLDLLKAALKRLKVQSAIDIYVKAEVPPGCGTGTSASVAVSLISALSYFLGKKITRYEIARLAHQLEIEELHLESGVQDQFAAAFGGINFMEIQYPDIINRKISISEKKKQLLENQLILVYLGTRSSSEMHKAVIQSYLNNNRKIIAAFETMKNCAYEMKKAIESDLSDIGLIMNTNWDAQKILHSLMSNPIIDKVEKIANSNNALGFKCNGAGGGGSAVILADIGKEFDIKQELIKNGFEILPFKLCFEGVHTSSM